MADKVLAGTQISFSSTSCYLFYGYGVIKEIGFLSCWHGQWLPEFTAYNTKDIILTAAESGGLAVSAQNSSAQADIFLTVRIQLDEC